MKKDNQFTINLEDKHARMVINQATKNQRRNGEYIRLLLIPELEKREGKRWLIKNIKTN